MKVNRQLQREILEKLYEAHPYEMPHDKLPSIHPENPELVLANMVYLSGHGLIEVIRPRNPLYQTGKDDELLFSNARITSAGIDFLENDGGLSAILKVVTIKLHEDTLATLLQARIMESDLPLEEKATLSEKLEQLGDEGSKHLLTKALDYCLSNTPNAISLISEFIKAM